MFRQLLLAMAQFAAVFSLSFAVIPLADVMHHLENPGRSQGETASALSLHPDPDQYTATFKLLGITGVMLCTVLCKSYARVMHELCTKMGAHPRMHA
jgi:hypothetical protein